MSPCGDASLYNIERNRHLALRKSDFIKCYQSSNECVRKGFIIKYYAILAPKVYVL